MRVRLLAYILTVLVSASTSLDAQIVCSGTVSGPDRKPLPRADVALLTPDRVTVLTRVQTSPDGSFTLSVPRTGLWVVRCMGVGGRVIDVALYVPDKQPIRLAVTLPGHRYLAGDFALQAIGDFNLWSIPKAVTLQQTRPGIFEADLPATTDSVTIRLRGYRDDDGIEGIQHASFILDPKDLYDARLPVIDGKAHVMVDTRQLDRARAPAVIHFEEAPRRTQRIAAAMDAWWSGEEEYFAHQNDQAFDRVPTGTPLPDWNAFVAGLSREAEAETDTLVRSFWDLGFVCTTMKTKSKVIEKLAASLSRMRPTSIAWSYSPNTLGYAARNAQWKEPAVESYVKTAMERHPDVVVRRRVLFNEFAIAFNAEHDARARKYYKILTTKYADTPEGKLARKDYPQAAFSSPKK
jgi:hypothetical protein